MIIPTILEKQKSEILRKINLVEKDAGIIQIDIVDPNLFDGETYQDIEYLTEKDFNCSFELDLLVSNPEKYISKPIKSVKKVCFNIKTPNVLDYFEKALENDFLVGLSLNIDTNLEEYEKYANFVDFAQFITVSPGGQGRKFETKKLQDIKLFKDKYPDIPLQVDGGINLDTINELIKLNVDNFVVGSAIFNNDDPVKMLNKFKERLLHERNYQ